MICDCGKTLVRFVPSGGAFIHAHYLTLEGKIICEKCAEDKGLKDKPRATGTNTSYSYVMDTW